MAWLAAAAPYISAASTAFGVYGQLQQGKMANLQGQLLAAQKERESRAIAAESQREALQYKQRATLAQSRARAVAAASGAGTDNINVENIIGDIGAEGEYQKLSTLYSGQTDADLATYAAGAARREGAAAQRASRYRAANTAFSGASDWYSKYG